MTSEWEKWPQAFRIEGNRQVDLLCCHCGGSTITLTGYGVIPYAKDLRGRVICETCDERITDGEDLPFLTPEALERLQGRL